MSSDVITLTLIRSLITSLCLSSHTTYFSFTNFKYNVRNRLTTYSQILIIVIRITPPPPSIIIIMNYDVFVDKQA